ncbi:hypothetical protein Kirov_190 [Bacillus phage Kirov]|uniref:Uncharacterized protein n=1 Tax=Bacillus phage Kirov TaxID=2783539 RepID=A0A7U3NJY5_9CAUD|nr:hypothetical protein PQE67_gp114 [Bacillus phage Kirov]QOV08389.1 hypothetical protein Kirov_190 [Bacillus phage Kirov]
MRYVFYGRNETINYQPKSYHDDWYGVDVNTIGDYISNVTYTEFFRKDNVHAELKSGTSVDINGESIYITSIQYDLMDDSYKCYTEKVLSRKDGNMTEGEAYKKLEELKEKRKGFFKKLFGG